MQVQCAGVVYDCKSYYLPNGDHPKTIYRFKAESGNSRRLIKTQGKVGPSSVNEEPIQSKHDKIHIRTRCSIRMHLKG